MAFSPVGFPQRRESPNRQRPRTKRRKPRVQSASESAEPVPVTFNGAEDFERRPPTAKPKSKLTYNGADDFRRASDDFYRRKFSQSASPTLDARISHISELSLEDALRSRERRLSQKGLRPELEAAQAALNSEKRASVAVDSPKPSPIRDARISQTQWLDEAMGQVPAWELGVSDDELLEEEEEIERERAYEQYMEPCSQASPCPEPFRCFHLPEGGGVGADALEWWRADTQQAIRAVEVEKGGLWDALAEPAEEEEAEYDPAFVVGDEVGRCLLPLGSACLDDPECRPGTLCLPSAPEEAGILGSCNCLRPREAMQRNEVTDWEELATDAAVCRAGEDSPARKHPLDDDVDFQSARKLHQMI